MKTNTDIKLTTSQLKADRLLRQQRHEDAVQQILGIAARLHLSLQEFDSVVNTVKARGAHF